MCAFGAIALIYIKAAPDVRPTSVLHRIAPARHVEGRHYFEPLIYIKVRMRDAPILVRGASNKEGFPMLTKITIALAVALIFGTASGVLAQSKEGDQRGGYRETGAGGFAQQGINDVFHPNSAAACRKAYPKSYDPSTMTFVGKDGKRHPCP
jgi:hypothetical protein